MHFIVGDCILKHVFFSRYYKTQIRKVTVFEGPSLIFIKVGDFLCWGFDLLDIHQRKYQLVSFWGMWLLMSIWLTLLPLLCINRGLCCLVCSPSSFLNHLSTIIVQLNVTLIHIGFQRHIVITEMTHWLCVLLTNLTNILVTASH